MKTTKNSLLALICVVFAAIFMGCRAPHTTVTGVLPQMVAPHTGTVTAVPIQEVPPTWVKVVRSLGIRRNEVIVYNHTQYYLFMTRNGQHILHDQQKQADGTYIARMHVIPPKGFSVVDVGLEVNDWTSTIIGAQAIRYDSQGRPVPVGHMYGQSYSASSWNGPRTWEQHIYDHMIIKD